MPRLAIHGQEFPWQKKKLREFTMLQAGATYRHEVIVTKTVPKAPQGEQEAEVPIRAGTYTVEASATLFTTDQNLDGSMANRQFRSKPFPVTLAAE